MAKEYTEFKADVKQDLSDRMTDLNAAVAAFDASAEVVAVYTINVEGGEKVVYVIEKP